MNILVFIVTAALALLQEIWSICPTENNITTIDGYRYTRIDIMSPAGLANQACTQIYYGTLVMIKTNGVSEAVDRIIKGCEDYFWIGLEYKEEYIENDWYWIDNTFLESGQSRWVDGYGQPGADRCARVVPSNQTWVDDACSGTNYPYICETNTFAITSLPGSYYRLVNEDTDITFVLISVDGPADIKMYKEPDYTTIVDSYDGVGGGQVTFTLESLNANDNGTYVIVASRPGIETSESTDLFVHDPASIISEVSNEVSSPVTRGPRNIECKANGIPTPTVRWTKNGDDVSEDSDMPGVNQDKIDATAILNIENAVSSDDGTYTCIAMNQVGRDNRVQTDTKDTILRVFGSPIIIDAAVVGCADDTVLVQLLWKANNQSLGINHSIEGTCYPDSKQPCVLATAEAQSDSYIETILNVTTNPNSVDIKVTVCPDDCIVKLRDSIILPITPNPVTNVSVTEINGETTESYCEVRWNSTQNTHTEDNTLFKVKETSTPVNDRDSSNISPLSKTDDYSYKTKVDPNTKVTFEVSVIANCASDAVTAQGECIADVAAPYEVLQPSGASSGSVSDGTHSVVVYVPNERNGPISCLFVIVRRGAENIDTVDLGQLELLSENAQNKVSPEKGDEYIASSISMASIYNSESITVVLGAGETSNCGVYQVTRQTSASYSGYNSALRANERYSVSMVTTTPNELDGIWLSQSANYTFIHIIEPTNEPGGSWWISLIVIGTLVVVVGALLMWKYINLEACRKNNSHVYEEPKQISIRTSDNAALHQQNESNYTAVNQSFVYETIIMSNDELH